MPLETGRFATKSRNNPPQGDIDRGFWETVQSDDVGYEEASEFRGVGDFGTFDGMGHLGHSIDEHEDRVLAV